MKALDAAFQPYRWAATTVELARRAGIDPVELLRFDGNVPPLPLPTSRPATVAAALATVNEYPRGLYPVLTQSIADYAGVEPGNVVLGAGADDLILLVARAFAGPGDVVAVADEPTYSLYRVAAELAGARVGDDEPVLTYCCRPNNPTGALDPLPAARPLVVDEAYWEYSGEPGAVGLIDDGVIVLRTFSKAFALAGARVGYALASVETAAELNARQAPAPVSSLSAALAIAALASPPDLAPVVEERERLAGELRALGFEPLPSYGSFLFVPVDEPQALFDRLLARGCAVRVTERGVRITVHDREDDDVLLAAFRGEDRPSARRVRHVRATAETQLRVRLSLDGESRVRVATGAGLYDHFLEQLAFHGGLDLILEGTGDGETGAHHTAEDAAIALGEALDRALGDRRGIARYGDATVPMDDALARAAVDLGGRRASVLDLQLDPGLAKHMLQSLADSGRMCIHVEATGEDPHHVAEAAFKAVGRALRAALRPEGSLVPSTKGIL
ncbi:MAG TPA: aminotransferase class I/II-fold pyridoxal phosphate-dependent enzyme [Gaiellaceae bacterium]|nr:aminotransferase class I/II-fold pyridoxal phosphate-dependent enzyme [Gaiellaceae bacterium]